MEIKEKLVELLCKSAEYAMDFCIDNNCEDCPGRKYGLGCRDWIAADNLIANGIGFVTDNNVGSKWISVKDMLPEELPENQGKKVIQCLVSLKSTYPNGKPNTQKRQRQLQWYGAKGWVWEWSRIGACRVTHWMPLPQPPKGE